MIFNRADRTEEQELELNILANVHVIKLAELSLIPLSTQLSRITNDSYNSIDFKNEYNDDLSAKAGSIIIHKKTGLRFLIPE